MPEIRAATLFSFVTISFLFSELDSTGRETPQATSRSDVRIGVDTSTEDFLSSANEPLLVFESSESQVISSTKSEALQALLSGRTEPARR